jgi:hypothetical protein
VLGGTIFKVVVPPASKRFVDHAELINTAGNTTYLDDPLERIAEGVCGLNRSMQHGVEF